MSSALLEKVSVAAESCRTPMPVTKLRKYRSIYYYICPRCGITMEREFMSYCDRCGQCLGWKHYKKAAVGIFALFHGKLGGHSPLRTTVSTLCYPRMGQRMGQQSFTNYSLFFKKFFK